MLKKNSNSFTTSFKVLELEKFKLIPKMKLNYLQQYAESVDVDAAELLKRYQHKYLHQILKKHQVVAEDEKIIIVLSHKKVAKTAPVSVSKPKPRLNRQMIWCWFTFKSL